MPTSNNGLDNLDIFNLKKYIYLSIDRHNSISGGGDMTTTPPPPGPAPLQN